MSELTPEYTDYDKAITMTAEELAKWGRHEDETANRLAEWNKNTEIGTRGETTTPLGSCPDCGSRAWLTDTVQLRTATPGRPAEYVDRHTCQTCGRQLTTWR